MEHFLIQYPHGKNKLSHVGMTGGSIYVPPERNDEFARDYIDTIKKGSKLFLVEQNNLENFRFFLDIDHKSEKALTEDEMMSMIKSMVAKVDEGPAIVLIAEPKQTADGKVKTGIHVVWYDFITNLENAMELQEELKEISMNSIDASVYRAGIRLPWSHKYDHKNKRVEGYYIPVCIVNPGGTIREVDSKPSVETFKLCCVRTLKSKRREGSFSASQLAKSLDDPDLYIKTEMYIRKYMTGQGRTCVKNIFKFKENYLVNTDSRYCENKSGRHSNNHVYFVINSSGHIYQKCHCKCDVNRKKGKCEYFTGQKYVINKNIHKKLFPKKYSYNFLDSKNIPGKL